MRRRFGIRIFALFLLLTAGTAQAGDITDIAGLKPDRRPTAAPVVMRFEQSDAWKAQALRGLGQPASGVGFLKDQGAWYTPFNRPNMPGRYDLRGLHPRPPKD